MTSTVPMGRFLREPRHVVSMLRLLVFASLTMMGVAKRPEHSYLYWTITAVYGATILGYLATKNRAYALQRVKWLIFLFDVVMVSALILLRGEQVQSFIAAYFALVLMAAIAENIGNAFVNAILVSVFFAILTNWGAEPREFVSFASMSHSVFFFIVAIFMGHVAQEARVGAAEREEARQALRSTTRKLTQSTEDLKAARDALQANERLATIGMFAAGIAHELKNPLAAIVASLEPAEEVMNDLRAAVRGGGEGAEEFEEMRSIVEDCQLSCEQLQRVSRDLTSVARGGISEAHSLDPAELVDGASRMLKSRTRNGLAMETRCAADRLVLGDRGRLMQVLLNLAGNALDAMEADGGDGKLVVSTENAGEMRVAFLVEDDGPGMPDHVRSRIFDPFFTTKPPGKGTGLGLHVVSEIVKAQRGTIECDTRPGEGTRFRIELPATESPDRETTHVGTEDHPDRGRRGVHPQGSHANVP